MEKTYSEMILVTDWERVDANDFYLSDDWKKSEDPRAVEIAKEKQKEKHLYVAYIVPAVHYAIYTQMDAQQVFIDEDADVILMCENAVISNNHTKRMEHEY